jgi:hypothetical protein
MAGSISFAPSSVPQVSGLLKDRALIKGQSQQQSQSSSRLFISKKTMSSSTTGVHKMGDQPVISNPMSRKSSVFTIENLLAPSIKSPAASPPSIVSINNRTSSTSSPNSVGTSPAAYNNTPDMVQQQFQQYHHQQQQNLFSVVGHHPHQHIMPLSLTDPAAYGYAYLGKKAENDLVLLPIIRLYFSLSNSLYLRILSILSLKVTAIMSFIENI